MIKRYFIISNLFLITIAIYYCVSLFYLMVETQLDIPHSIEKHTVSVSQPQKDVFRPLSYYSRSIVERNLFNTKTDPVEDRPEEPIIDEIPKTQLNLRLLGTVAGTGNEFAVIEDQKERRQELYHVGDAIQDATVKYILRGKVVLTRNGQDEILKMKEDGSQTASAPSDFRTATERSYARGMAASQQNVNINRSQIDDALANVNDLMKQVKIRPHFEGGKPNGLVLSSIKSRSIFRKMGLRNGDIVMGIDGQDIVSVDDALKFYENLRSASNVSLQIKRRGKLKTIDYQIQ